jgi:hypothetical protein
VANSRSVLALAIAFLVSSDCSHTIRAPSSLIAKGCHQTDGLPDSLCTPGAVDPRVTQSNIRDTICAVGYTATVRPKVSYTNALKVRQIAQYGYTDAIPQHYEEDHLIPLELGGDPSDPANLWPEPGHSPNPKDAVEKRLHHLVCTGKMTLPQAQTRIRTNWKTALE